MHDSSQHPQRALVLGASGAIGGALVDALREGGSQVTALSRRDDGFDLASEASIARHLGALDPGFDLILCATGALEIAGQGPEKSLSQLDPGALAAQFALNATGPALVIKHALRLMPRDRRAVLAVLSARVGSISDNRLGGWYGYRAAKAALNQILHGAAIEVARSHPRAICLALHPGTVQSALTRAYLGRHPAVTPPEAARHLLDVIAARSPADSGGFYDWRGDRVPW
ncbi:SDR family NAD(P)-dependent oxidoreductase [Pseudooceanicola sp. CBS1P-1]|uniref:SDR family NAD(P)-dependent oxidoreductase n=1 Tax=Pseudooceanicola albus TaxID=2692189 RepID=A0A6L7G3M3_9RHOB|nr:MULTISPECIES: SDR family NAD(P)-dependent oxidoreductase [Pseudooceanicola]MBT9384570.1 SDR family NAD(P)-dependent oxidoreductase [Pseudooceanicola endophyticus]MXN18272.1 SDR family NAD(P)-dependent oxidoreductase [Pseudooceanicola albus]